MAESLCATDEGILLEERGRSMIINIYTVIYCNYSFVISEAFLSMTNWCLWFLVLKVAV